MGTALAWIRQHPGFLGLIAAVLVGQLARDVGQPYGEHPQTIGTLPLVPVVILVAALVLAIVIAVLRVQVGHELLAGARSRTLSLPSPESLPARYAVADPPRQIVDG